MGTYVRDALETDLLASVDLATDATDSGDALEIGWPGDVLFLLTTGTVSGTNKVVIQGCETSDFSTADVVTLATIDVVASDDSVTRGVETYVDARYVRAVVTIGTGGDMSASTLKVVPKHYKRDRGAFPTASALA